MASKPRILITGSSGMLGVDLCEELYRDYKVYGIDVVHRPHYAFDKFYNADITDKEEISSVIKQVGPDIVVHTAAWTDVDGCELNREKAYRINSDGTENIALACKERDAVLIYISTDFVFDGRKKSPYKETDRPNPVNVYAESKLRGEEAVRKIVKNYFILRTSWLFGKHGKSFVDTIFEKACKGAILKVVDDQVGSPTYTGDFAKAMHVLLDKLFLQLTAYSLQHHHGTYHITNAGSISWYEYAKEILTLAESETKIIPISSKELARPAKRPAMSVLDNSKFIKFTGYRMRSWRDALKDYLKN